MHYSNCVKEDRVICEINCTNREIETRPVCQSDIIEGVFTFASLSLIVATIAVTTAVGLRYRKHHSCAPGTAGSASYLLRDSM